MRLVRVLVIDSSSSFKFSISHDLLTAGHVVWLDGIDNHYQSDYAFYYLEKQSSS